MTQVRNRLSGWPSTPTIQQNCVAVRVVEYMRQRALLAIVALALLLFAGVEEAFAWRPPTPEERTQLTEAAARYMESPTRYSPLHLEGLNDIRISELNENWAAGQTLTMAYTPWLYFQRVASTSWRVTAGSTGCLYPRMIHAPTPVAIELESCRPEPPPTPKVPNGLFAFPPESSARVRPRHINLAASACAPEFAHLRWKFYGRHGAEAVGLGLFPYFPTATTSCLEAPRRRERTRLLLSRPRHCTEELVFTRLRWKAHGEHGRLTGICRSPIADSRLTAPCISSALRGKGPSLVYRRRLRQHGRPSRLTYRLVPRLRLADMRIADRKATSPKVSPK